MSLDKDPFRRLEILKFGKDRCSRLLDEKLDH